MLDQFSLFGDAQDTKLPEGFRYQSGLIDFQSLLEAERSLLSSRESRLNARAARSSASVQLYKALGGGWPSAAP